MKQNNYFILGSHIFIAWNNSSSKPKTTKNLTEEVKKNNENAYSQYKHVSRDLGFYSLNKSMKPGQSWWQQYGPIICIFFSSYFFFIFSKLLFQYISVLDSGLSKNGYEICTWVEVIFGRKHSLKTKVGVLFGFQQIWLELCLPSENMASQKCFLFHNTVVC